MTIDSAASARIFVRDWNHEVINPMLAFSAPVEKLPALHAERLEHNARRFRKCAESQLSCAGLAGDRLPNTRRGHEEAAAVLIQAAEECERKAAAIRDGVTS